MALIVFKPTSAILIIKESTPFVEAKPPPTFCNQQPLSFFIDSRHFVTGYSTTARYMILDQFGFPYQKPLSLRNEIHVLPESDFLERNFHAEISPQTDQQSMFQGCYIIALDSVSYGVSMLLPSLIKARQIIFAEGFEVVNQELDFQPTDIEILTPPPTVCPNSPFDISKFIPSGSNP